MTSLSRTQFPPGGWQWFDPSLNWSAPTPIASTFDQTVQLIIRARAKNPALAVKHNLSTDKEAVSNELEAYTRKRLGMDAVSPPKSMPSPLSLSKAAGGAVRAVKQLAAGASLLFSWEESGLLPVGAEQSARRAAVCATCPQNQPDHLSKFFTARIAETYRQKFEKLHAMKLETPDDEKLGVCQACLCPLRLKCHAPTELIEKHMRPEVRSALPAHCWVIAEISQANKVS